jgi:hypothetical protein
MFCGNCGGKINDDATFCNNCGALVQNQKESAQNVLATVNSAQTGSSNNTAANNNPENKFEGQSQGNSTEKTNYAGTAFWCSIAGLPLICLCGIGFAMGFPAVIFGGLALKNKETDIAKAWLGIMVGFLEIIGFVILILAIIRSE